MPFSRESAGSLAAAQDHIDLACAGYGGAGIRLSGTFSGTVTFEGSVDGRKFDTLTMLTFDGTTTATTATTVGQWVGPCAGLTVVRVRMSSYTSGTAVAYLLAAQPSGARVGGGGGAGNPAGPSASVQFNNSAVFGGTSAFTFDGTTITLSGLSASAGLSQPIFASDTGLLGPLTGVYYNPAYTGPPGTQVAHPSLVTTTTGFAVDATVTSGSGAISLLDVHLNYAPATDSTSGNTRGFFSSTQSTGTHAVFVLTAGDFLCSVNGAQAYTTILGTTVVATTGAASTGAGGIIAVTASGIQEHAGATTPLVISLSVDPTNGGTRTLLGTISGTYYGTRITGMSVAGAVAVANRIGLFIDTMAGTPTTDDYAIKVAATQPIFLAGKITTYNNVITSDIGVIPVRLGQGPSATKTANFTLTALTPPAVAGRYRITMVISTDAATNTGTLLCTLDYTNGDGTVRTNVPIPMATDGNFGANGVCASAVNKGFHTSAFLFTIDASGSAITPKVVITGAVSYKVSAYIEQLA